MVKSKATVMGFIGLMAELALFVGVVLASVASNWDQASTLLLTIIAIELVDGRRSKEQGDSHGV